MSTVNLGSVVGPADIVVVPIVITLDETGTRGEVQMTYNEASAYLQSGKIILGYDLNTENLTDIAATVSYLSGLYEGEESVEEGTHRYNCTFTSVSMNLSEQYSASSADENLYFEKT